VLATTALAHLPDAMLPVIFCNLLQHVVAAVAVRTMHCTTLVASPAETAEGLDP
jgi:hypothetical protein